MNLDKLPSRYSKMADDPGITGDVSAAARLLLTKGGKPGALRVDGQAELENVILRPGFLRWSKEDPIFNLKAKAASASSALTQDLMASLAAKHLQKLEGKVSRGQATSEFTPAKPKVVAGATKEIALNGLYGLGTHEEGHAEGGSPVGKAQPLTKEEAVAAQATMVALAEKELADAIKSGDAKRIEQAKTSLKNAKGPAFPPIMLILGGVAVAGVVAYLLLRDRD